MDWIEKRRTWAIGYLVLVPAFAFAFSKLPAGSFHDANIAHESALADDSAAIRTELATWIAAQALPAWRDKAHDTLHLLPRLVRVGAITDNPLTGVVQPATGERYVNEIATGGFLIEVSGLAQETGQFPGGEKVNQDNGFDYFVRLGYPRPTSCDVLYKNGRRVRTGMVGYTVQYRNFNGTAPIGNTSTPRSGVVPVSYLFGRAVCVDYSNAKPEPSDVGYVDFPKTLNQRVYQLFQEEGGDPAYASHTFARMLYVSATTVATLGLGDITPVSDWARLLVGVEAVLGVLFIGLFLNAVARRWRTSR